MSKFIIQGGYPLHGTHVTPGNKNAALPMIAASLLADSRVEIRNVPLIRDVDVMLDLVKETGARVDFDKPARTVVIDPATIATTKLPKELCTLIRTSILFAGPLVAKFGEITLPPPGGDVIGRRRLDTHFDGLERLGARFREDDHGDFVFTAAGRLKGAGKILLDEAGVTATENIVMAAVTADGCTEVFNAACEPHVKDLCHMLNKMGADISGIGTNRLVVKGVPALKGGTFTVGPDYIESAGFIAAAAATGGSIRIDNTFADDFAVLEKPFAKLGVTWQRDDTGLLTFASSGTLKITDDFFGAIPKIDDGVWPSVPTDLLSVLIVLATQADGIILFFEKMFESRMYFVDHLIGMGAQIVQCDPHRVVVKGRSPLRGATMSSPDIRAGMALIVAGLCAKGETVIHNAQSIDRGYESIEKSLAALGAHIERQD